MRKFRALSPDAGLADLGVEMQCAYATQAGAEGDVYLSEVMLNLKVERRRYSGPIPTSIALAKAEEIAKAIGRVLNEVMGQGSVSMYDIRTTYRGMPSSGFVEKGRS